MDDDKTCTISLIANHKSGLPISPHFFYHVSQLTYNKNYSRANVINIELKLIIIE